MNSPTATTEYIRVCGVLLGVEFSTHERGFLECSLTISATDDLKRAVIAAGGTPWVEITDDCEPVWSGRVERVGGGNDTVTMVARGPYSAFTDLDYTAVHAMSDATQFKPFGLALFAGGAFNPGWWVLASDDNGLYLSPRKGETHGGSTNNGSMYWMAPHRGNEIHSVTYTYEFFAPVGWQAIVDGFDYTPSAAMTFVTRPWTLNGNGAVQTGTTTQTFASSVQAMAFTVRNTNAAAVLGVDTGTYYLKVTNITVWGGSSSETSKTVVAAILADINTNNAGQVANTTVMVETAQPVTDACYYSAEIVDVLFDCFGGGDSSGYPIEYGIWDDRVFFARRRGSYGRTWYVDESDVVPERGFEDVYNAIRGTWRDSFENVVAGTEYVDALSQSHWGVVRRSRIETDTTRLTSADAVTQQESRELSKVVPSVQARISSVVDGVGVEFPLYVVRACDNIVVRSMEYGDDSDSINAFRITHTRYSAASGKESLTIELESPRASSAAFIGAASERVRSVVPRRIGGIGWKVGGAGKPR